mgnify:CR=1 FL=1|jgi:mercuric transport protein
MKIILSTIVLAFIFIISTVSCTESDDNNQQSAVIESANKRIVTLDVANMTCATCPYTVKKSLIALSGVGDVEASLKNNTAIVTYDTTKVTIDALVKAVTNAGYPAKFRNAN